MFFLRAGFRILQNEPAFAADGSADFHNAVDLGDLGCIFRTARFEQLRHTRQTTSDILCLGNLPRCLGQQRAGADFLSFLDNDVSAGGNGIAREHFLLVIRR